MTRKNRNQQSRSQQSGKRFYVVWVGYKTGVFASWATAKAQVEGFAGAKFKGFPSEKQARQAFADGWELHWGTGRVLPPNTGSKQLPNRPSKEWLYPEPTPIDFDVELANTIDAPY